MNRIYILSNTVGILSKASSKNELVRLILEMSAEEFDRFEEVIQEGDVWSFITWMGTNKRLKWEYDSFDWKETEKILDFLDNNNSVYQLNSDNDTYNLFSSDDPLVLDLLDCMRIDFSDFDRSELE